MTNQGDGPRFMRFAYEFEIEITDPLATQAFNMWPVQMPDGDVVPDVSRGVEADATQAVGQIISQALAEQGPRAGFAWRGGAPLARTAVNGQYLPTVIPAMPVSNDDA